MYNIFIIKLVEFYFGSLNYEYNVCYRDKNMSKSYVMLAKKTLPMLCWLKKHLTNKYRVYCIIFNSDYCKFLTFALIDYEKYMFNSICLKTLSQKSIFYCL